MTKSVKSTGRIRRKSIRMSEKNAASADGAAGQSFADDPVTDGRRRVVAGSGGNRHLVVQSEVARDVWSHVPGPFGTLKDAREPADRDFECIQDLLRPRALPEVKKQRARRIRRVGGPLSGEAEPDVVLGQEHACNALIGARLFVPKPKNLRSVGCG